MFGECCETVWYLPQIFNFFCLENFFLFMMVLGYKIIICPQRKSIMRQPHRSRKMKPAKSLASQQAKEIDIFPHGSILLSLVKHFDIQVRDFFFALSVFVLAYYLQCVLTYNMDNIVFNIFHQHWLLFVYMYKVYLKYHTILFQCQINRLCL